jgi:hypothetical protein
MYAAAKGDAIAMRLLVDAGADVYTLDNVSTLPSLFFLHHHHSCLSPLILVTQNCDGLCDSTEELSRGHATYCRGLLFPFSLASLAPHPSRLCSSTFNLSSQGKEKRKKQRSRKMSHEEQEEEVEREEDGDDDEMKGSPSKPVTAPCTVHSTF